MRTLLTLVLYCCRRIAIWQSRAASLCAFGAVVFLAGACTVDVGAIPCEIDSNCNLASGGTCVLYPPSGQTWCQYPDPTCPSGRRWSDYATYADILDQCVMLPDAAPIDAAPPDASLDAPPDPGAVIGVSLGLSHSCMWTANGQAYCWGYNGAGQLGDATTTSRSQPTFVPSLLDTAAIAAEGSLHTCALRATGTASCWGSNGYGELGDGSTTNRLSPTPVRNLSGVTQLAAGGSHTCALFGGVAQCWGWNLRGELGDGSNSNSSTPRLVTGLTNVTQLAAGGSHTCALIAGQVRCWGNNSAGQLGDGTTTSRNTPAAVIAGLTGVVEIAAGAYHTCARRSTNQVYCWGRNTSGQLGDSTTTNRNTPVLVGGLSATHLAAGGGHSCARRTTGDVVCWGGNASGQLGDGGTVNRSTPTPVVGLTDAVDLAAGGGHTCALRQTGALSCWGGNTNGQLGDGTSTDRLVPTDVLWP